jgi:D-aminopeptidase
MEGASGIFEENRLAMLHGSDPWRGYGRECLTSDTLAVCEAANEFGIDEILIYDGHFAGNPEHNILLDRLPANARLFDTPDRCFYWRRIRGQAASQPFGLITIGQHSRNDEKSAFFPHTIQSPPIKEILLNGMHIAEIGFSVLSFYDTKYLANIGCKASMKEAKELSKNVATIVVKDKDLNYKPSYKETYNIIKAGVLEALKNEENIENTKIEPPYHFSMSLMDGFHFEIPKYFSWKGTFSNNTSTWEAPSIEIGLELFDFVREYISKDV